MSLHSTYYRLDSKGKIRLWEIKVTGNLIETWDGVLDGKYKYTPDEVREGKNIGKANETTPEEQALSEAKRKITIKQRRGYTLSIPEGTPEFNDQFFNNPPRNFVGPKPLAKMPPDLLEDYEKQGRLIFSRKWNGMCCHIVIGIDGEPRIFTSTMDEKTDSFPEQVEELRKMCIPPGSWFMAEAVSAMFYDGIFYDCPDRMKTVFGSKPEKAIEWQEKNGKVEFKVFNTLFYRGKQLTINYGERLSICVFHFASMFESNSCFDAVTEEVKTIDDALDILTSCPEYEGFVIWDLEHTDMPIKFGGAASRKGGAWKLKSFKECDCLVYKWETGKGKLNDEVATLHYGAYDSNGDIVHLGCGGSGLDDSKRKEIAQATLPIVVELKYEEITKAGRFRLPVLLRVRNDKAIEECTLASIVGSVEE